MRLINRFFFIILLLIVLTLPVLGSTLPKVKTIAGLSLVDWQTGQTAMDNIHHLHRMNIDVEEGLVAHYQAKGKKQVVIWASLSKSEEDADKLLKLMVERMPQSRVFTKMAARTINTVSMHYVFGMGMDNYYYRQGKWLFWIAVGGIHSDDAMSDILMKFKGYK